MTISPKRAPRSRPPGPARRVSAIARLGAVALGVLPILLSGCTVAVRGSAAPFGTADRDIIRDYFDRLNAAGERGRQAQARFLRRTQHPDYRDRLCDLGGLTVETFPVMSTLREAPDWAPEGSRPPRGLVYVIAVSLTIRRDGANIGEQIGSEHVVVLDGAVYGFAPCPK